MTLCAHRHIVFAAGASSESSVLHYIIPKPNGLYKGRSAKGNVIFGHERTVLTVVIGLLFATVSKIGRSVFRFRTALYRHRRHVV